ncbi:hypothetical protein [Psychromonas sp. KJ10-2]|uniref:hypothetical protein n=1 Tax=Psychromonas sp. KJ10-2 TaxID=3391822 RepID=UPI0039B4C102
MNKMLSDEAIYKKILKSIVEHQLPPGHDYLKISYQKPLVEVAPVFEKYYSVWP